MNFPYQKYSKEMKAKKKWYVMCNVYNDSKIHLILSVVVYYKLQRNNQNQSNQIELLVELIHFDYFKLFSFFLSKQTTCVTNPHVLHVFFCSDSLDHKNK